MSPIGRNDPCPCGSGQKYKKCCGREAAPVAQPVKTVDAVFREGHAAHLAGQPQRAEACYREVIRRDARHVNALQFLAMLMAPKGHLGEAAELLQRAVSLAPLVAELRVNLGNVLKDLARYDEAHGHYREAQRLKPDLAEAWYNLGDLHLRRGQWPEAVTQFRNAVAVKPDFVTAEQSLALALHHAGDLPAALAQLDGLVGRAPDSADVWNHRGVLRLDLGRVADARADLTRALHLRPAYPEAWYNLGNVATAEGQIDQAIECYLQALALRPGYPPALTNLGNAWRSKANYAEAVDCYRRALQEDLRFVAAYSGLGATLLLTGDLAGATAALLDGLQLAPQYPDLHNNLGLVYERQGRLTDALACFRRALSYAPADRDALNNLGATLKDCGHHDEAMAALRTALSLRWSATAHSNILFVQHFHPDTPPAELLQEAQNFGSHFAAVAARPPAGAPRSRLRIGYLSPDFRDDHPVAQFILPVLAAHDHSQFEIHALYCGWREDATAVRMRSLVDGWHALRGLNDADAAALVAGLDLDVLIDLAGHTADNRLPLVACHPARVTATWLGFLGSTGLPQMDFRITDAVADPPGAESRHSERLLRLPQTQWVYAPPALELPVTPLPAESGCLTLASFSQFAKLNRPTLLRFARLLHDLPHARLLLLLGGRGDMRAEVAAIFAEAGVAAERLDLVGRVAFNDYLAMHQRVDIALDSHPYSGATTTCHALWMGVPVLTLPGVASHSRSTASLLAALGMGEWIAADAEDFHRRALALAGDLPQLAALRAALRARMQGSPLMDAARFTRDLEDAYRTMLNTTSNSGR